MIKFKAGSPDIYGLQSVGTVGERSALSLRDNGDGSVTLVGYFGCGNGTDDLLTILPSGVVVPEKPTSIGVRDILPLDNDGYLDLTRGDEDIKMINQLEQLGVYK